MAEKSFSVKEIQIQGSGTPTIESPSGGNLNVTAATTTFSGTVSTSLIRQENSGNPSFVHLGTGGRVGILQTSPGSALEVKGGIRSAQTPTNGHIDLKHDGTNGNLTNTDGHFLFYNTDTSSNSGDYIFHNTGSNTQVFRISRGKGSGGAGTSFSVNTTLTDSDVTLSGSTFSAAMVIDGYTNGNMGSALAITNYGLNSVGIRFKANATTATIPVIFHDSSNTVRGSIQVNATTNQTTYATTSDYRLKENEVIITDGIVRLKQLKPYKYNWIDDSSKTLVDGFFAHEVQSVVPQAITGTKDEVDSDGNAVVQGIDYSKLVPLLTAALQEEVAKREALEARVAALEGS